MCQFGVFDAFRHRIYRFPPAGAAPLRMSLNYKILMVGFGLHDLMVGFGLYDFWGVNGLYDFDVRKAYVSSASRWWDSFDDFLSA